MRIPSRHTVPLLGPFPGLLLATVAASAQQATSPGYQLQDLAFESAAGGSASVNFTAFVALGELQGQGLMVSPGFSAAVGFLESHDPDPGLAPVVFEVGPFHGPKEGGTLLTLRGTNFTKFGGGPSTQVLVGGQPATGIVFSSDTELTCFTPPGAMGLTDVVLQSSLGAAVAGNAFVFEPAVLATATAPVGGSHLVRNFGEPGALCAMSFSLTQTFLPLGAWGVLEIGPAPTWEVIHGVPYPAGGELQTVFPIPENPALSGLTLYFQTAEIALVPTLAIQLTNSDSMLIL